MINFILQYGTITAIILRVISCTQIAVFVIPLQIKESAVRNGLVKLRRQLLSFGIVLFLTNVVTTFFLISILHTEAKQPLVNASLQLFNAVAFLIMSTIGFFIYHSQYSDESKDFHAQKEVNE